MASTLERKVMIIGTGLARLTAQRCTRPTLQYGMLRFEIKDCDLKARHAMTARIHLAALERISCTILVVRGQRVILDRELAAIYGVSTGRLNEAVKRNPERFPADFMFQLTAQELENLRSQVATSSWGRRRYRPFAFTEHGAIQAANVLNSPRAVAMGVYVVRAFIRLREILASNKDLAHKLAALERSLALDVKTQKQFNDVYDAIRALTSPPPPRRRGSGFTADLEDYGR